MKKIFIITILLVAKQIVSAQNIGINFSSPRFPLSFAPVNGEKISLWDNGNVNGTQYGFGIQNGVLQLHTDFSGADVVFGYGKSSGLNETVRFKGNGRMGIGLNDPAYPLDINSRFRIRNRGGNNPAGVIFTSVTNDNDGAANFTGLLNDTTVGMGQLYQNNILAPLNIDIRTGNVGIATKSTNYSLSLLRPEELFFPPFYRKMINLYPAASETSVGFGIGVTDDPSSLLLYSDNINADVAFGYDQYSNGFNEIFAVKPSGALAILGNTGNNNDILQSNGSGSAANWKPITFNIPEIIETTDFANVSAGLGSYVYIPGLSKTFNMTNSGKVMVDLNLTTYVSGCIVCGRATFEVIIVKNGVTEQIFRHNVDYPSAKTINNTALLDVSSGSNTIDIYTRWVSGSGYTIGAPADVLSSGYMTFEILD
ncbi:hypothetical protein ACQ33O_05845 [Ferruginibacter sp. SUN002]|uniref:hypothetical protein n=1 Tax=Ferruginibacter sp. SUN002 TaxID=2937789 RepID=UPI003D36012A